MVVDRWLVLMLTALIGAAVGSFLNVLILRTRRQESALTGRSRCLRCGATLRWFELIPLLSFGWQRGRCRHCKTKLSWQYPLVEILTAAGFVLAVAVFGFRWTMLLDWLIVGALIAVAVYDWRWALLPDAFTLGLAVVGLVGAWSHGLAPTDILLGGLAGAGFFGLQFVLSRKRWVGSGDILLGAALGLLLGWRMLGLALLLAYFIGALAASVLVLMKRRRTSSSIAFGPYLTLGAFIAWLWGPRLIDWYFNHALFR